MEAWLVTRKNPIQDLVNKSDRKYTGFINAGIQDKYNM